MQPRAALLYRAVEGQSVNRVLAAKNKGGLSVNTPRPDRGAVKLVEGARGARLEHGHLMPAFRQLGRQTAADRAAAYDNDIRFLHGFTTWPEA